MRALLLFEGDTLWSGWDFEPRTENWNEILDECIAHDGDNALYDYLAALTLWKQSAEYDYDIPAGQQGGQYTLNIKDEARFALGTERFRRGQNRKYLAIGEDGYATIAEFLSLCHLSKNEQSGTALSRLVTFRQSTLFLGLWRWQQVRADVASGDGAFDEALAIHRQNLRLYDQAAIPEETSALSRTVVI